MQSSFGSKDRKRSSSKQGSGGYYQFTYYDDELSDPDDGSNLDLSPKELVAKALQDSVLDTNPVSGFEDIVPEPDFSFDFLQEGEDNDFVNIKAFPPQSLDLRTQANDNRSESEASTLSEGHDQHFRAETPESLHSPLDNPDSGYIEFISPSQSSGTSDQTRSHSEGFEDDFTLPDNFDDTPVSPASSGIKSPFKSKTKSVSLPQVRYRRYKADFEKLEEDKFIDDEINTANVDIDSRVAMNTNNMNVELQDMSNSAAGRLISLDGSRTKEGNSYLPMPMSFDEKDAILDPEQGQLDTTQDDTNPIMFVEQTVLTERYKKRRKKAMIAIGVIAVCFGLAGLGAITYCFVRFLIYDL